MILTKESKEKLKTFLEFPNTGRMYEVLKAAKYKTANYLQTCQKHVKKSKGGSCKQTEFNLVTCLWIIDISQEFCRSTEYRGNHNCNKIKKQISDILTLNKNIEIKIK